MKPKDKTPMEQQRGGGVYQLNCNNCNKMYIGETSRSLGTRYKEDTAGRHPRTAVGEHLDDTGHKCSLKEAKILDKEDQLSRRRIKEAIRPSLEFKIMRMRFDFEVSWASVHGSGYHTKT